VAIATAAGVGAYLLDETEPVSPPLPSASFRLSADGTDAAPVPVADEIEALPEQQWGSGEYDHYAAPRAIPVFLSLVHMLRQQRLIDTEEVTARSSHRSTQNGPRRSRTATITYLRYSSRSGSALGGGRDRRYTHRWVVRGHWRRQWYPSLQRHVPIWITDYIAGPEDAPIMVREKVRLVS